MKISFFIGKMLRGGAEKVISILANHYIEEGYEVDLVMLLGSEINYAQFPLSPKINVVDLSPQNQGYWGNSVSWLFSIRNYVKHSKSNCIISFVGRINALVLTATIGQGVPTIVSERNDPKNDGRGKLMLYYCNFIYRRASKIIFQSKHEQNCFTSKIKEKSIIIPNPVQVPFFNNITINERLISTAGRLNTQKNHTMLINAMDIIKKTIPDVRCEIYGEGPERNKLENFIKEKGLENVVLLPGNKEDVHKYIVRSKFFVMTSDFEGMSNSLLEAMMLGKVCISTDYPGADEVICNKENGIIVSRGNAQELAKNLIYLLQNPGVCNRLSDGAKLSSEKYSYSKVLSLWDDIVSSIVS